MFVDDSAAWYSNSTRSPSNHRVLFTRSRPSRLISRYDVTLELCAQPSRSSTRRVFAIRALRNVALIASGNLRAMPDAIRMGVPFSLRLSSDRARSLTTKDRVNRASQGWNQADGSINRGISRETRPSPFVVYIFAFKIPSASIPTFHSHYLTRHPHWISTLARSTDVTWREAAAPDLLHAIKPAERKTTDGRMRR